MAPTLLKMRYDAIKLANVKIFASFVEFLTRLALPSVSRKNIQFPYRSFVKGFDHIQIPSVHALILGSTRNYISTDITPLSSNFNSRLRRKLFPVLYFPAIQQNPTGVSALAMISSAV